MAVRSGKKILKIRLITIVSLAIAIFMLMILADHPRIIERYYSEGFYILICKVLHPVFNLFPFSVGDVLYLVVIGWLFYALFLLIRHLVKKRFAQAGLFTLGIIAGVQTAVLIFYLFWGMNYFRLPAADRLHLHENDCTTAEMVAVTCVMIDSANACRARVTAADLRQSNSIIYQTAIKAVAQLSADSANFRTYSPDIKSSILTPLLNYMGTSGYYNPFTSESQMNYQMPVWERPVVACHELSHQVGYNAEDEANFAGFLAGIGSRDRLLRYSAYQLAVEEFMHSLRHRDTISHRSLKARISPAVISDFKTDHIYWLSFESKAGLLSSIFYDDFLKANNQPQGLRTYNRMVLLVMAWYKWRVGGVHRP